MNALSQRKPAPLEIGDLVPAAAANDVHRTRVRPDHDPFTRSYRKLARKLRAAAAMYVDRADVDDLVQDVWTVASQSPAKLAQDDARTLSWLIGVAKRCSPSYASTQSRFVPLDVLLAGESGDDLEGRAMHEDVTELGADAPR